MPAPANPIIVSLLPSVQIDITKPPYAFYARLWLRDCAPNVISTSPMDPPHMTHSQSLGSEVPNHAPQLMAGGSSLGTLPGISLITPNATLPTTAPPSLAFSRAPSLASMPSSASVNLSSPPGPSTTTTLTSVPSSASIQRAPSLSSHPSISSATQSGQTAQSSTSQSDAQNARRNLPDILQQCVKQQTYAKITEYTLASADDYLDTIKQRLDQLSNSHAMFSMGQDPMVIRAPSGQSAGSIVGTVPSTSVLADYFINVLRSRQVGGTTMQ